MGERHRAPRQEVTSIVRTDGYGTTRYLHRLVCGHTEVRRRPAPAPRLGCAQCARELRQADLTAAVEASLPSVEAPLVSVEASMAIEAFRLRAGLARLLLVDLEDVSMASSETEITGAYVWVSASSLRSLRDRLLS